MSGFSFEQLSVLWEEGERRLRAASPRERRALDRVVDALVMELRRRLGGPFTTAELAALYLSGTEWCFDVATKAAPGEPEAWDMPTVTGAAFHRYVRRAMDYGGGRRRLEEEED